MNDYKQSIKFREYSVNPCILQSFAPKVLANILVLFYACFVSETPKTTSATFRYPPEVLEAMRILAHRHGRSLNQEMVWAARRYIETYRKPKPPTAEEAAS